MQPTVLSRELTSGLQELSFDVEYTRLTRPDSRKHRWILHNASRSFSERFEEHFSVFIPSPIISFIF